LNFILTGFAEEIYFGRVYCGVLINSEARVVYRRVMKMNRYGQNKKLGFNKLNEDDEVLVFLLLPHLLTPPLSLSATRI
jgi:hypothetical protein